MKKVLILLAIVILLAACQKNTVQQASSNPVTAKTVDTAKAADTVKTDLNTEAGCQCDEIYEPVCANGQLINNACTADCMGIKNYVKGECNTLAGKQLFPCGETTGGLSAQHNPVCGRVKELSTGITYWKTFPNAMTACQISKMSKLEVKEFTRGECG